MMKVIELTKENEEKYLEQVAELEQIVLTAMKKEGREGQLFATGKEDISNYVHSDENTVMIALDEKDEVESAAYITQGQKPFTYNDITKYFKYGTKYREYVKTRYSNMNEYKKALLDTYKAKINAFQYAKSKILQKHTEISSIHEYLEQELQENGFHEKSELRENLNEYMSEYIRDNFPKEMQKQYEEFYWITAEDISKIFEKDINDSNTQVEEYEQYIRNQMEYEEILQKGKLTIHETPEFDETNYYTANTQNSIELDTYITNPNNRSIGCARILVYEGIKKHMEKFFSNPENKEIFLCSTLHRDNLSSKYVSEFFGLKDSLYVNRRQGRDREVHICKISREEAMEYLTHMSDKLAVLYDYNPNQKHITQRVRRKVLQEQLEYEKKERKRLVKAKTTDKSFKGINVKYINQKAHKIKRLEEQLQSLTDDEVKRKDEQQ